MALIGVVALVVIGPEKLPRVARTMGTLLGKAQRYVADVKAEVNRSMDLDELRKMKDSVESAARDVEQSVQTTTADFEKNWAEATAGLNSDGPQWKDPAPLTRLHAKTGASNAVPRPSGTRRATGCVRAPSPAQPVWRVTVRRACAAEALKHV